jgi:serine protease SohB
MEFLANYGLFLLKAVTILVCVVAVVVVVIKTARGSAVTKEGRLKVERLNKHFRKLREAVEAKALDPSRFKALLKKRLKEEKKQLASKTGAEKDPSADKETPGNVYVLDFNGDLRATAVEDLREEISALLPVVKKGDEVVVRLESSGGLVHSYGLAAAQLARLKEAAQDVKLTVCVDRVAASGGYMIACVADRIVAAPFAVVGSIGVAATVPNFHRLLDRHAIDVEQITAGEFKRTLSLVGKNTEKGRAKFNEQIQQTHRLFKDFVSRYRPGLDLDTVANGEHWYGLEAHKLGLVDALSTSDDVLLQASAARDVLKVSFERTQSIPDRLGNLVSSTLQAVFRAGFVSARRSELER